MSQLLLVDDERNVLNALARVCRDESLSPSFGQVRIASFVSPYGALEFARHHRVDAVVSDYQMPEMNGASLLMQMRTVQPEASRILLSAFADRAGIIRAINDAAIFRFLDKPWNNAELKRTIGEALAAAKQRAEDRRLADEMRVRQGMLTPEEVALRALEAESPGITQVDRTEDGGVRLVT